MLCRDGLCTLTKTVITTEIRHMRQAEAAELRAHSAKEVAYARRRGSESGERCSPVESILVLPTAIQQ